MVDEAKIFLLNCVTKSEIKRISYRKKKQSRKGQAESTAQTNKILTKSKETDKNGNQRRKSQKNQCGAQC